MRQALLQSVVTYFDPQPEPTELPSRLASPFAPGPPPPLARRAAEELLRHLRRDTLLGALDTSERGKMFGVLVVETPEHRVGYLRAFSGMLGDRWQVEGFAPPLFDLAARDAFWPEGQAELDALDARIAEHRELDSRRGELERLRANHSRHLWRQLNRCYVLPNARGEEQTLEALFAPEVPPGGAGDCAAPKLLALAYRLHLRPLALAEFWWGPAPLTGDRREGEFYPACHSKCGKVLPYMLSGLAVDPAPPVVPAIPEDAPRLVYEDPWLMVVDKPRGLLSLPGRHEPQRDSVLVRLRARHPDRPEPLIVRPLEPEISGLLLVAQDSETYAALHRQLARGEADKRYTAWLDGPVAGDHGVIAQPLRVDPLDRPRHIIDPARGKHAVTEWRVTERTPTGTRVSLVPRTDRTHQLRVHAAHALGLGAPIMGDRLYGGDGARLLLHAECLVFTHPRSGERLTFDSPAPF